MTVLRRILFFVFDQFELLDLSGPSSVFSAAQLTLGKAVYSIHTLSLHGGLVCSRSGIEVNSHILDSLSVSSSDTILLVGGARQAITRMSTNPKLQAWLKINGPKAERIGSICSGALILAESQLLNGRQATTHWADLEQMTTDYPSILVDQDALYCIDDNIWTSAGVTAGIDMALAMAAKDHGRKTMQAMASWLVVYAHRPGNQSQFSELLTAQYNPTFGDIISWIDTNLHRSIKVVDMAEQALMTERTFYRKFTEEICCTPSKFLEKRRLFRAKQLLESGRAVKSVYSLVGYQSELGFVKAFRAMYGLTPSLYKRMHVSP